MYTEGVEASREMKMDLDPLLHGSVEYPNADDKQPKRVKFTNSVFFVSHPHFSM